MVFRVLMQQDTNVLEDHAASLFRVNLHHCENLKSHKLWVPARGKIF
jgi:hypothetical protein